MVWWHKADIRCSHFMSVQVQILHMIEALDHCILIHPKPHRHQWWKFCARTWLLNESLLIHTALVAEHSNAASNPKIFHQKMTKRTTLQREAMLAHQRHSQRHLDHFGFAWRKCPERSDRFASSWTPLRLRHGCNHNHQSLSNVYT